MKNINVLCPECMRAKLVALSEKSAICPNCGQEFEIINKNTVRYK